MERDVAKLVKVILIGSVIPLIVYCIWEIMALGIIPLTGEHGIIQGYKQGNKGAYLLTAFLDHS